ncbi:hypothetical protein P7K49_012986 [Saguinus oedipus]|uniref:Uncharacterized protein n=1 Tax=Saguinus oedipus TaxID=9490 RepID=A0ABQ9VEY0_SAGOE|nr:hypothetical protein P7K49_012986 [Saguinus oedipus]
MTPARTPQGGHRPAQPVRQGKRPVQRPNRFSTKPEAGPESGDLASSSTEKNDQNAEATCTRSPGPQGLVWSALHSPAQPSAGSGLSPPAPPPRPARRPLSHPRPQGPPQSRQPRGSPAREAPPVFRPRATLLSQPRLRPPSSGTKRRCEAT